MQMFTVVHDLNWLFILMYVLQTQPVYPGKGSMYIRQGWVFYYLLLITCNCDSGHMATALGHPPYTQKLNHRLTIVLINSYFVWLIMIWSTPLLRFQISTKRNIFKLLQIDSEKERTYLLMILTDTNVCSRMPDYFIRVTSAYLKSY